LLLLLAQARASDPQTTQKSKKQRPRRLRQRVLFPINAFMGVRASQSHNKKKIDQMATSRSVAVSLTRLTVTAMRRSACAEACCSAAVQPCSK
jgi:hypothetical protein